MKQGYVITSAIVLAAAAFLGYMYRSNRQPSSLVQTQTPPARVSSNEPSRSSQGIDNSLAGSTNNGLVGHWECVSSPMPTGLFLFRIFDFQADHTFRSIDSLQARPPVRVLDGTWMATDNMIDVRFKRTGASTSMPPKR